MKNRAICTTLVCILALAGCQDDTKPKPKPPKIVRVQKIAAPIASQQRLFPGKVEASDRVNLSFQISGRIEKFPVKEGDEMQKGAIIAKLDPSEFQYRLNQAQARYNLRQSQEKRYATLRKDGHVSQADYDKELSAYEVAKSDLKQAKKNIKDSVLYAPFHGTIIRKYVKLFQQIKSSEHIVSFQDIEQIDIRVNLPEKVIAQMKRNTKHDLKVTYAVAPSKTYPVTVKEFSAEADPETQTFDAILTMPAPKNINILPGMTATLIIQIPTNNGKIFLVPSAAVFKNKAGKSSVWLVKQDNTLNLQSVAPGKLIGQEIQIKSGIKAGDTIVIAGVHFLKANEKIKPQQVTPWA